jgi:chromobox protein 1
MGARREYRVCALLKYPLCATSLMAFYCSGTDKLTEYYERLGGRDLVLKGGNKRSRPFTSSAAHRDTTNGKKRKTAPHQASSTLPASLDNAIFKPPSGSWEEEVQGIDLRLKDDGVMALLQWPGGYRTQHPLDQVYKRCPQKVCLNV